MHCLDWKWTKLECLSVWQRIRCAVPSPTQKAALSVNTHSVDAAQRNNIRESKTMRGMKHKSLPDTKGICFVFSLLPLFLLLVRLTSCQLLYHCVLNCHYLCTLSIDPDGGEGEGRPCWPIDRRGQVKKIQSLFKQSIVHAVYCICVCFRKSFSFKTCVLHLSFM